MKKTIYVTTSGQLKREQNTLCLINDQGKRFLPVEDISEIFVLGEVDINKKLLEFIASKEIILHFFNYHGYYVGSFYPREHYNSGYMTILQAQHYIDNEKRTELAKAFVQGAYNNIRQVLMYYSHREKPLSEIIGRVEDLGQTIDSATSIDELMAIEGNIRETYYKAFDIIIDNQDFVFDRRSKRPPTNEINAMISFGNSLMYTTILSEIYKTHLDPRIGFLHASNFRRFSLNLDVAEIFKPIIVDRVIFTLLGRKMLDKSDFMGKLGGIVLDEKGKTTFIKEFENKLTSTISHRELGRNVSYRRLLRLELYKLEKHLMGEKPFQPFKARW